MSLSEFLNNSKILYQDKSDKILDLRDVHRTHSIYVDKCDKCKIKVSNKFNQLVVTNCSEIVIEFTTGLIRGLFISNSNEITVRDQDIPRQAFGIEIIGSLATKLDLWGTYRVIVEESTGIYLNGMKLSIDDYTMWETR